MPTIAELQQQADDRNLIRKIQKAIAFLAPTSAELPADIFDTTAGAPAGALIDLKAAGYLPVGLVTPDGWTFGREINKEDVSALGYASAVRSDITQVTRSVSATLLESGRKHILELKYGTKLDGITQDATTGSVVFDEPDLPVGEEYRLLVLGSDGPADNRWILGRGYGLVKLASTDDETWSSADPVQSAISLDVFTDNVIGAPVRHYMGGTGALKNKTVLGFNGGV